ncbi:AraC family transcriptional regulator [Pectobacterium aquaticum]|uniref:AraC family transcriptional regulator n=1 Tax=Pectobacterium aquaticum TaxID=2204145 RepID=UPI001D01A1D6|nr:AraC family transcriptional regulator [Pectobacterium aquaticum]UEM37866.1 AraC family transcriptional regulator [Pectobacterium aquaticum]
MLQLSSHSFQDGDTISGEFAFAVPRLAEACGYKSSARFSERFKNRFGCSPTQIR